MSDALHEQLLQQSRREWLQQVLDEGLPLERPAPIEAFLDEVPLRDPAGDTRVRKDWE